MYIVHLSHHTHCRQKQTISRLQQEVREGEAQLHQLASTRAQEEGGTALTARLRVREGGGGEKEGGRERERERGSFSSVHQGTGPPDSRVQLCYSWIYPSIYMYCFTQKGMQEILKCYIMWLLY